MRKPPTDGPVGLFVKNGQISTKENISVLWMAHRTQLHFTQAPTYPHKPNYHLPQKNTPSAVCDKTDS